MFGRNITKILTPAVITMISNVAKKIPDALAITAMGVFTSKLIYENQREHDVKAEKFDASCSDIVKDSSQFEIIDKPHHASLTAEVVRDTKTGNEYVKKAAHSRKTLVKEFMFGNFLNLINKNQPECLIMQTTHESGTHFHTLSRKAPNSQDVEDFVRAGRTHELQNKKVIGLEASLAADQVVGKQSDTKLSNQLIRETPDAFIFSSIDNERAVSPRYSLLDSGKIRFPTDPTTLVHSIHDLGEPSADNKSGLSGDARAKEFGSVAKSLMTSEKVKDYYRDVATANVDPIISHCYRLANHSTLFKSNECSQYQALFHKIQKTAAEQVASMEHKP